MFAAQHNDRPLEPVQGLQSYLKALRLLNGEGVTKNVREGITVLEQSAKTGFPPAMHYLMSHYEIGAQIPSDFGKFLYWAVKAAEIGHSGAMTKLAYVSLALREDGRGAVNQKAGLMWAERGATLGNEEAKELWDQVRAQKKPSFNWSLKVDCPLSAHSPSTPDEHYLRGMQFAEGIGLAVNRDAAFLHFREAANGGSPEAWNKLASCYAEGLGTAQDMKMARECLEKSASLGNSSSMANLGLHLLRGSFDFPHDEEAAYQWFQRAAELGNGPAQYHLSERSYGEKDFVRAVEFLRQSVESKHIPALITLASLHMQEDCGLKKEPARVSELLRTALKLGYGDALPMLAHNDLTIVPSRNGVLSPVCAHGTTDQERGMAYTRFRLGDWGQIRTWEWDENDRRLSGSGIIQGRYPLEDKPAILVCTHDKKSYFMCFEGEVFDKPDWEGFWMGFINNTFAPG